MNREILFRGKRMDNGEWVTGDLLSGKRYGQVSDVWIGTTVYNPGGQYEPPGWEASEYDVDPATVGQYTGLKDKNGTRIFEGDILRNVKTGEIVSVKWHGTMAGFVWSKRRTDNKHLSDFGELFRVYDKYEVVGNIHDHPELLGG